MRLHNRNQNKMAEQLHLKNSLEKEDQQSGHVLLVKFGSVTRLNSTFLLFDNKYIYGTYLVTCAIVNGHLEQ